MKVKLSKLINALKLASYDLSSYYDEDRDSVDVSVSLVEENPGEGVMVNIIMFTIINDRTDKMNNEVVHMQREIEVFDTASNLDPRFTKKETRIVKA